MRVDMKTWRLLDTGRRTAAENMTLDEVILECRAKDLTPDTVRFLRFEPPAVLVGYHQDVEQEVRLEFVRENGIDVNRRLTGGGAIYFDNTTVGWEVVTSRQAIGYGGVVESILGQMCECVIRGLGLLGVKASFRPRNDIEVDGRKISGTGGVERGAAFLFQGTLLVDFDVETMVKALRIPIIKLKDKELESAKKRVTCLRWELGETPSYRRIRQTLITGFEEVLGVSFSWDGLAEAEQKLLEEKLPWFRSDDWVFLDRRPQGDAVLVHAVEKKPGGIIRVSLSVDKGANLVKSVLITGDFFASPPKALMDLEAALKLIPCDVETIREAVHRVFREKQVRILGITADDLVKLILEALDKTTYDSLGIEVSEANHLYPIVANVRKVVEDGCEYLLLPYCAKPFSCEYRWKEGCGKCGGCTVGAAYELAGKTGLKPVTVQSFEHLVETLQAMKKAGAKGYIGCCCEAFYLKHKDDMERAGVQGIVIDIDDRTCYDLGKAENAYEGRFEGQTKLKLDLLSKVTEAIIKGGSQQHA